MVQRGSTYAEALLFLSNLKLHIVVGESVIESSSDQAALLTAVNAGSRAFHGGVTVSIAKDEVCTLPLAHGRFLSEMILELGGVLNSQLPSEAQVVCIGAPPRSSSDLIVLNSGWRAGVISGATLLKWQSDDFQLGSVGVAAGALAVHQAFCVAAGLSTDAGRLPFGVDFWDPRREGWLTPDSSCVKPNPIVADLWLLGLGHLGQGFIWNLLCLETSLAPRGAIFFQDTDSITEGNYGTSLLCKSTDVGRRKTEVCEEQMRLIGYQTTCRDIYFDEKMRREPSEPGVAICGFDNPESRSILAHAGFDRVLEAGIGDAIEDFDSIVLHTLPHPSIDPALRWKTKPKGTVKHRAAELLMKSNPAGCGTVFETIASKSVSSSFVGAFVGACHCAELLRMSVAGSRVVSASINMRCLFAPPDECLLERPITHDSPE